MISAAELGDALGLGRVRDEELVGLLSSVLPLSQTESGDRVSYFHPGARPCARRGVRPQRRVASTPPLLRQRDARRRGVS